MSKPTEAQIELIGRAICAVMEEFTDSELDQLSAFITESGDKMQEHVDSVFQDLLASALAANEENSGN